MSVIYDKKNKLWLNVNEPDSIDPNISLGQKLLHWMCENEFKVAQVFTQQSSVPLQSIMNRPLSLEFFHLMSKFSFIFETFMV